MKRRNWILLTLTAVLALGLAGAAWAEAAAEEPANAGEASPSASNENPRSESSSWIDEKTGRMRAPTAAEAAKMGAMLKKMFGKSDSQPRVTTDKSGMMTAELDERFLEFSVVRIAPDGSLEKGCVDNAEQALEFIEATAETAGPEEE